MAEALTYLLCAAVGGALLHFAEKLVAQQRRLNEAIARRLPRRLPVLLKRPEAAYGAMYLFYALGGMMLGVLGLIGFVMSL